MTTAVDARIPADGTAAAGRRARRGGPRRRLFAKYAAALVGLVSLVLLINGSLNVWFSYDEARDAAIRLQREKAEAAAQRRIAIRGENDDAGISGAPRPAQRQDPLQQRCAQCAAQVKSALAPVEARLAENPPSPRPQISAERGKETRARRRDLTAFIGEYDVPHGHKCIGNSDSYLASQVIVATSGKTECIVVC